MADDLKTILGDSKNQLIILFMTLAFSLASNWIFKDPHPLSFLSTLFGILVVIEMIVFMGLEIKDGASR